MKSAWNARTFSRGTLPPTNTTQLQRIRAALAQDISNGLISVDPKGQQIVVDVNNDTIHFKTGSADADPAFAPIAQRIAAALDKEPGPINVIGHTDNVPMSGTGRYKSNYDLSLARAKSIGTIVAKSVSDPSRIVADGRGETDPIADNGTQQGRARNRRVEIMIPREETLK